MPYYLQELEMEILPQNTCRNFSGYYNDYNSTLGYCVRQYYSLAENKEVISTHILCAKSPDIGKGTCSGDSGGPLTVKKDGQHVLVGVNSGGFGCGLVSLPLEIFFHLFWDKELRQITSYPFCKALPNFQLQLV